MSNQIESLEIQIVEVEGESEWQVWTPDTNGAVIGSGETKDGAIHNAVSNLSFTITELSKLLP